MSKTLFDVDDFSGIIEHVGRNIKGDIVVQKSQDTRAIVNANRIEINSQIDNNFRGDMHKMASIPLVVIEMWREEMKKKGFSDCNPLSTENRKFLKAKLNSPDWNALRTKQGVI